MPFPSNRLSIVGELATLSGVSPLLLLWRGSPPYRKSSLTTWNQPNKIFHYIIWEFYNILLHLCVFCPIFFFFLPWNVRCWMRHGEECHHPDPWCWPLLRLPAAALPHHSTPGCTPRAVQSSLEIRKTTVWAMYATNAYLCKFFSFQMKLYKVCLTGKIFYIHISSLTDELLDAAYLSTDCCSVQPSLSSLISLIHFVFGFRCRVWCSLLTHTGLWLMLWCCV